jgi:hypothetical protein
MMSSIAIQEDRPVARETARAAPRRSRSRPDDIVLLVENHLESWRQIMHFVGLARGRKVDRPDEDQFLELKGVIVQELEMILASGDCSSPLREDVHEMMNCIPSLAQLSQVNDAALRNVEHKWHLIYISWHATLGQLKVKHKTLDALRSRNGFWQKLFSR